MLRFLLGVATGVGLYHLCMQKETQDKISEMYECAGEYFGKAQEKMKEMAEEVERKAQGLAEEVDEKMKE